MVKSLTKNTSDSLLKAPPPKATETAYCSEDWDLLKSKPIGLITGNCLIMPIIFLIHFHFRKKRQIEGHTTDITSDLLIQWIKKRGAEKPFSSLFFLMDSKAMDANIKAIRNL